MPQRADSWDLSSFLPGKKKQTKKVESDTSKEATKQIDSKPEVPKAMAVEQGDQKAQLSKDFETREAKVEITEPLPLKEKCALKEHYRAVSALTLDASGSLLLSGGYDYNVNYWDFNGMDMKFRPFRTVCPFEGYHLKDLSFIKKGGEFLVVSSANQVKMFDRVGSEVMFYAKGDQYIKDMRHTYGHVAAISCLQVNPADKQWFLTGGHDSTVRVWNIDDKTTQKYIMIAKTPPGQGRTAAAITAASFTHDGALVVAARKNGGISVWDWKRTYLRPKFDINDAHTPETETSRIIASSDGHTIVSRGGDETVKLWDLRMFSKPVVVRNGMPSNYVETDVSFSPKERYILTGTSFPKGRGDGSLQVLDKYTLQTVNETHFENEGIIRIQWHEKLNQVFCSSNSGSVYGFYDPEISSDKGLILSVNKGIKKRKADAYTNVDGIYLPHALPMFKEGDDWESDRSKRRKDPTKSFKPEVRTELPQGPVGQSQQHIIMQILRKDTSRDEDPRAAFLKHAEEAEKAPVWTKSYYETQPKTIYDFSKEEEKKDDASKQLPLPPSERK